MTTPDFQDPRLTEQRTPRAGRIDVASSLEIVDLINAEDALVPPAVRLERERIARAIELAVTAFERGGRLIYVGAGTSGRLGVLDASECPPTFGTPPEMVVGIIAGGYQALVRSIEGAEDDVNAAASDIEQAGGSPKDFVLGVAASGTTPFVRAALGRAQTFGAATGLLSCTDPPRVLADTCDVLILPRVGAEVVTGSTRMKAGTATKLVLNTITTGAMIRLGKVYGNLMVDLMATSDKLRDRGERIVMECCAVDRARARAVIADAAGSVKLAIGMARPGVDAGEARRGLPGARGAPREVAFVACHGQTVWHEPGRATLQLGDAAVLAERVGVRVVSDFRARDVAAGGQGAPLVALADVMLFGDPERGRLLLNLGGMANVTWVPRRGVAAGAIAFDTGPGVAVIDAVTRRLDPDAAFDKDGERARRGRPIPQALDTLLADGYLDRKSVV